MSAPTPNPDPPQGTDRTFDYLAPNKLIGMSPFASDPLISTESTSGDTSDRSRLDAWRPAAGAPNLRFAGSGCATGLRNDVSDQRQV